MVCLSVVEISHGRLDRSKDLNRSQNIFGVNLFTKTKVMLSGTSSFEIFSKADRTISLNICIIIMREDGTGS